MSNRAARRHAAKSPADSRDATVIATAPTAEPEALVVTHYFDAAEIPDLRGPMTVRLTGRRIGTHGTRDRQDTFTQEDRVDCLLPGSGPASVTSWIYGLAPGEWSVTAEMLGSEDRRARRAHGTPIRPARWSWRRWALTADAPHPVKTRWALLAPLARMPGVEVLNDVVFTQVSVSFGSDERTRNITARLLAEGTTWMSGSHWAGRDILRISVSNWTTNDDDIAQSLAAIERAVAAEIGGP